jgi:hypothetical protein
MMQNPSLEAFHLPTIELTKMAGIIAQKVMKRVKDINHAE